jgi:hypothetical protein
MFWAASQGYVVLDLSFIPLRKQISFYPHISHIFRIIEAAISYQRTYPRDKSCLDAAAIIQTGQI